LLKGTASQLAEKLDSRAKRQNLKDRKSSPDAYGSFIGHPGAIFFEAFLLVPKKLSFSASCLAAEVQILQQ